MKLTAGVVVSICVLALSSLPSTSAGLQTNAITVQVDRPGATILATLFGLFFEDINFGADGGNAVNAPRRVRS
ncbi:MAG TPA: hypothetical protein VGV87_15555 [Blastocatellia bacterium]|jgi:hypothetical protein|nr:hypothetical protein [Blastocatellia bacterium]